MTPLERAQFNRTKNLIQQVSFLLENNSDTLNDFSYERDKMEESEIKQVAHVLEQFYNLVPEVKSEFNLLKEHFEEK